MSDSRQPYRRVLLFSSQRPWLTYLLLAPFVLGMAILGVMFFTAFLALFVLVSVVIGIRIWWLRRKLRRQARSSGQSSDTGGFLEGEYIVVNEKKAAQGKQGRR